MRVPQWRAQACEYTGVSGLPRRLVAASLGLLSAAPLAAAPSTAAEAHWFSVGGGLLRAAIPPVITAGVVMTGDTRRANLTAPQRIDLAGAGLAYRYAGRSGLPRWLDRAARTSRMSYRIDWSRFSGDASDAAEQPAGAAEVGLVPTKFGAPPAPNGFFPGPAGLASRSRIDVDTGRLRVGVRWRQQTDWLPEHASLWPGARLGWTQLDYYHSSRDRFLDAALPPVEFSAARDQRLQHDIFDLTVGGRLEYAVGSERNISVFAELAASVYFLKATLVSYEFFTVNGARQRRFTGGGVREFSPGGELSLGAVWRPGAGWELQAALQHQPWVPTGRINNPLAGGADGRPTFLGTAAQAQTLGLLTLSYRFGGR